MTRIGVISDTRGLLRPEATAALAGVQRILHAGDIGRPGILERLADIAPVDAIRGNVDTGPWAQDLPQTLTCEIDGLRLHMLHDRNDIAIDPQAAGIALVISGHSHRRGVEEDHGITWLNPGSAGPRRFRLPVTLARVEVAEGRARTRILPLPA